MPAATLDDDRLAIIEVDTCFDRDAQGRLTRVNEPDGDAPPRVHIVRTGTTVNLFLRDDVPAPIESAVRAAARRIPAWDKAPTDARVFKDVQGLLGGTGAGGGGPAFRFPSAIETSIDTSAVVIIDQGTADSLERFFAWTRLQMKDRGPIAAIIVGGDVVATCYSARNGSEACEAGVDTIEAFRGQGFAPMVVSAWRHEVESSGRLPLYSTSWTNSASQAVARKLGLIAFADTFSIP